MLLEKEDQTVWEDKFASFVRDRRFPCVGAKAALSRGALRTLVAWSVESAWDDVRIHRALLEWAFEYRRAPGLFRSLAVIFAKDDEPFEEARFEKAIWNRIQSLSDKDAWLEQP
jgi:uncharacterized protein